MSVILFLLVLYRLPRFTRLTNERERLRDVLVATAVGGFMTVLVLTATAGPFRSLLTPYFAENNAPLAKGRNIVNGILVDFCGKDTLGEITVLRSGQSPAAPPAGYYDGSGTECPLRALQSSPAKRWESPPAER